MKKYFSILAVAIVALTACNKNESPVPAPETSHPVKMTLTATIGGQDTKVTYADEDNVLKAAWDQYDKVSLLSLDADGYLLSNDVFTATSAGKSVEFDGDFTNDPAAVSFVVYYPALTQGNGEESNKYMSPVENGYSDKGVLQDVKKGGNFITIRNAYYLQTANASTSHLEQYAVMAGPAEMQDNKFSVEMEHLAYVVKAVYTLPGEDCTVVSSIVRSFTSSDANSQMSFPGWRYIESYGQENSVSYIDMNFGSEIDSGTGKGFVVDGNDLTVYYVGYGNVQFQKDAYLSFHLDAYKNENYLDLNAKKYFDSDKTLEPGKMYRLSVTLESRPNVIVDNPFDGLTEEEW